MIERVEAYCGEHARRFEDKLCELLRIPSVSADGRRNEAMEQAAQWLEDHFRRIGLRAERIRLGGPPLVYAESPPRPGRPTALVYGHYDVQPADPLDQWRSPPFEPTRRGGDLVARGATDDKGQMLTHVHSVEAWLAAAGQLPIQVKYLIEGEEEVGSGALSRLLEQAPERLACDAVVISDMSQFGPGRPAITYGLRGIAAFELRVRGPKQDLHSGAFGGAVANPAVALARILGSLIDDQGRIQIPGFYDQAAPLGDEERRRWAALPFDERRMAERLGVDALWGEAGYTTLERRWGRPAFDINGVTAGYQGEGSKTIIPACASAKFSFRLVPRQDPQTVAQGLRRLLEALRPPGVRVELIEHHGSPAVLTPLDSPYLQAAARAVTAAFGREPVMIREGGSIPIVAAFQRRLGADTLLLGWGQEDDNPHGPNEKFALADYHRGIRASARLWDELSRLTPSSR